MEGVETDEFDIFSAIEDGIPADKTSEEEFCFKWFLGNTGSTRVDELYIWVSHQISIYKYLFEDEHVRYVKGTVTEQGKGNKDVPQINMVRYFIKYYLMMRYLPSFQKIRGVTNVRECDIDKVTTMLMDIPKIKSLITKTF